MHKGQKVKFDVTWKHIKARWLRGPSSIVLLASIHPIFHTARMSFVAPYSSSVVAVLPVLTSPQLEAKRMVFHGAIAGLDDSSTPVMVSYWPSSEPRAAALGDTVFISASIRFTTSNGTTTAISDASYVNVLVDAERAHILDPASDNTAVFFLTGMVLSDLPVKREFVLETGCWSTEVYCISVTELQSA